MFSSTDIIYLQLGREPTDVRGRSGRTVVGGCSGVYVSVASVTVSVINGSIVFNTMHVYARYNKQ